MTPASCRRPAALLAALALALGLSGCLPGGDALREAAGSAQATESGSAADGAGSPDIAAAQGTQAAQGDGEAAGSTAGADAAPGATVSVAPDAQPATPTVPGGSSDGAASDSAATQSQPAAQPQANPSAVPAVEIAQSLRPDLAHGPKPAEFQKYIVLHDTEGGGSPYDVIDWWESDGQFVASHFVIGRDGEIVQVVPLDEIAHHAGFGDAGHNELYGTPDESRDDLRGTAPIGDWAPDYGMNSYSVGIELIHQGEPGEEYPEAQLEALDALIAYIDDYYGIESQIIDHKDWRSYNSDTSAEFAGYLANYQATRTHDGS